MMETLTIWIGLTLKMALVVHRRTLEIVSISWRMRPMHGICHVSLENAGEIIPQALEKMQ